MTNNSGKFILPKQSKRSTKIKRDTCLVRHLANNHKLLQSFSKYDLKIVLLLRQPSI